MNTLRYRDVTPRDWLKVLLYVVAWIGAVVVAAVLLSQLEALGAILWLIVFAGSLFLLVRWHARSTVYRCPACGNTFAISTLTDLVSPHVPNRKFLRCPGCRTRRWATILMRVDG